MKIKLVQKQTMSWQDEQQLKQAKKADKIFRVQRQQKRGIWQAVE